MSSRAYDHVQLSNDQKDLLISQLKAEVFELKNREQDYDSLNDQVLELEHKCNLVHKDKTIMQDDYQRRLGATVGAIRDLEGEVHELRLTKDQKELTEEAMLFRDRADGAGAELSRLHGDLKALEDEGLRLMRDKARLEDSIASQQSQKMHYYSEIDRQKDFAAVRDRENSDALTRLRVLELDHSKGAERAADLQRMLSMVSSRVALTLVAGCRGGA